jgi:hypothetical protein
VITSLANLLEALAFPIFVSLYIWRWQEASPKTWLIFPVWLLLSFALHRDTPKTIGWRADNLKPVTRRAAPIFLLPAAANRFAIVDHESFTERLA